MKKITPAVLAAVLLTASACGTAPQSTSVTESSYSAEASAPAGAAQASYRQITQEQAKEMMRADDGHIIVDVRRQDEYDSGHIPGAVLIPNETIGTERPEALPDPDGIILIYCRSGRRSKEAAQKLADMGYTNVYEFGGIIDWTGEIVTDESTGSAENEVHEMKLKIGEQEIPVTWEANASVDALKALLPLTVDLSMYGGFEQVGSIGQSIVRNDVQMTTKPGDIVLYSGDRIVLFYGSNTWSYTKLGTAALSESELKTLLGSGDVQITLSE